MKEICENCAYGYTNVPGFSVPFCHTYKKYTEKNYRCEHWHSKDSHPIHEEPYHG